MKEFEEAEQKRLKIVENTVRLRGRLDKGLCYFVTRLFRSDVQKIASQKHLNSYQTEKLQQDMVELSKFANKLKKEQRSNKLVIGNANHKLQVDDKEELDQILHFFNHYGKEKGSEVD